MKRTLFAIPACLVGFGIVSTWLLPVTASAEPIPALLAVPAGLTPELQSRLGLERESLEQERQAFLADAKRFNAKPAEAQTDAEFAALGERRTWHISRTNAFNREVVEAMAALEKKNAAERERLARENHIPSIRTGGAGDVRGDVFGITPDGRKVPIKSGSPIFLNEHITTGPGSRLQVMLLDESVFILGPDSDIVLDEFVYDPSTSAEKIVARLTKGVFRFVTGKVARPNPDNMRIRVPTGTIGIRGTDVEVSVAPDNSGYIKLFTGKLEITETKTGEIFPVDAGQMVTLFADGTIGRPVPLVP